MCSVKRLIIVSKAVTLRGREALDAIGFVYDDEKSLMGRWKQDWNWSDKKTLVFVFKMIDFIWF